MTSKFNNNLYLILFITIVYSLVIGSGFYGFGHDYYVAYYKENLNWGNWQNNLGFRISTFTIFEKNWGVHIVSALLALSSGIFIKFFLIKKKIYSTIFFILIYILVLHTWPIIMSTSNAMRQGITMSLIYLCFACLINQKYFIALIAVTISIFTHKSGILYFLLFLDILVLKSIIKKVKFTRYFNAIFFILFNAIFLLIFIYYFLIYNMDTEIESRIIKGDFRYQFLLLSLIFILIFTVNYKSLIFNDFYLFMYLFSFSTVPTLLLGFNWQYERLMMMMTIPYLLIFSTMFNKRYSYSLLLSSVSLLLILTIYQGMYESLK